MNAVSSSQNVSDDSCFACDRAGAYLREKADNELSKKDATVAKKTIIEKTRESCKRIVALRNQGAASSSIGEEAFGCLDGLEALKTTIFTKYERDKKETSNTFDRNAEKIKSSKPAASALQDALSFPSEKELTECLRLMTQDNINGGYLSEKRVIQDLSKKLANSTQIPIPNIAGSISEIVQKNLSGTTGQARTAIQRNLAQATGACAIPVFRPNIQE